MITFIYTPYSVYFLYKSNPFSQIFKVSRPEKIKFIHFLGVDVSIPEQSEPL